MINNRRLRDEMYYSDSETCIPQELVIENVRLSAAYVPYQFMCEVFSPIESLAAGTAFPELFSPYNRKDNEIRPCGLSES
ncbi:spore coat associated protein CotJA [Sedimentibacter sp.]|uniref:spore coat associated protein CotJA n=1 Tax=Sedimentibacter sp. TaxID=1960295 RepID=UPI0028AB48FD|nr:spore coat associated protein CotJA [Sedimentibacter sp.]